MGTGARAKLQMLVALVLALASQPTARDKTGQGQREWREAKEGHGRSSPAPGTRRRPSASLAFIDAHSHPTLLEPPFHSPSSLTTPTKNTAFSYTFIEQFSHRTRYHRPIRRRHFAQSCTTPCRLPKPSFRIGKLLEHDLDSVAQHFNRLPKIWGRHLRPLRTATHL